MDIPIISLSVILLQVFGGGWAQIWDPSYFRIEILFERFEDNDGIIHNGKYCDTMTDCDPRIYTAFDIDTPFATYPGSVVSPHHFQLVFGAKDRNVINMDTRVTKNVCNRPSQPKQVTLRVQAMDHDMFTANDLIDNLDCTFAFTPTPRHEMHWSDTKQCRAMRHPDKIKLFFKWRIFRIHSGECYSTGLLELVTRPPTTTTTATTTTATTKTTTTISTTTPITTELPTTSTEEWVAPTPSDKVLLIPADSSRTDFKVETDDDTTILSATGTLELDYELVRGSDYPIYDTEDN